MENNVVSLETAKKLKAAEFPQETTFGWNTDPYPQPDTRKIVYEWGMLPPGFREGWLAAPTAQEIADQLPPIEVHHFADGSWRAAEYADFKSLYVKAPTMAEALAALYLALEKKHED